MDLGLALWNPGRVSISQYSDAQIRTKYSLHVLVGSYESGLFLKAISKKFNEPMHVTSK